MEVFESSTGDIVGRYTKSETRVDPITPTNFCLGGQNTDCSSCMGGHFRGDITAFQLFSYALSDSQVLAYRASCPTKTPARRRLAAVTNNVDSNVNTSYKASFINRTRVVAFQSTFIKS